MPWGICYNAESWTQPLEILNGLQRTPFLEETKDPLALRNARLCYTSTSHKPFMCSRYCLLPSPSRSLFTFMNFAKPSRPSKHQVTSFSSRNPSLDSASYTHTLATRPSNPISKRQSLDPCFTPPAIFSHPHTISLKYFHFFTGAKRGLLLRSPKPPNPPATLQAHPSSP